MPASGNVPLTRALRLADWPEKDRAAWAQAMEPADIFAVSRPVSERWGSVTQRSVQDEYGRWLDWLRQHSELDPAATPADRASIARARAYYRFLVAADLAECGISSRSLSLARALGAMHPDMDWTAISRPAHRLHAGARPRHKRPVRSPEEVIQVGIDLMEAAEQSSFRTSCERAVLYRDGLIIAFLVHRPLRSADLHALDLERQLVRNQGAWRLHVRQSKTGRELTADWPAELIPALERYLDHHRPQLFRGRGKAGREQCKALWISARGTRLAKSAIQHMIADRTAEVLGEPISPHQFRRVAATAIATNAPESVTDAASALGHSSLKPTEEHYIKANSLEASRRYAGLISGLRG